MERFVLENDIPVMYVTADSFPDGIMAAHHTLHAIVTARDRVFFGVSFPNKKGVISYKAGVEQFSEEEAKSLGLETYTIRKGNYNSVYLKDYFKNPAVIGETFQQLLDAPDLDPSGACIEMYVGERDVRCMVRII
ncbi:MAG: transcriptional regulator [Cytophagaceae bacterium]|jgi:hypothetical protein|nr:transcriptional regulator [Cytophagaceae bacterium]